MPHRSTRIHGIGFKVGLVFVAVVALVAATGGAVAYELYAIRTDAERLLEETRESSLAAELASGLELLVDQLAVAGSSPAARSVTDPVLRRRLAHVRDVLHRLDRGPDDHVDPSRAEHQATESSLTETIDAELDAVTEALDAAADGPIPARLDRSMRHAEVLLAETREEAEHAEGDLFARARHAVRMMVVTIGVLAAALVAAFWLFRRSVVAPLRALRERAARLGDDELPDADRGGRRRDEIGALARTFDEMAARVAATTAELQDRVETRTRELMRAARFADIGVLAAGVAHEINNPLASIATSAEGLERRLRRGEVELAEQLDYLQTISQAAYRARDITTRLLALAQPDRRPDELVDVGAVLRQVELLTRHQLENRGVRLAVERPAAGPHVLGDAGELLQLVVNLVLNARDASPAGAAVRVRAEQVGAAVEIVVDDAGPGVPDELAARIFDPFFTTKAPGEGTGLGLALVAAIVEAHRGTIRVGRSPARGARFTVTLAAVEVGAVEDVG